MVTVDGSVPTSSARRSVPDGARRTATSRPVGPITTAILGVNSGGSGSDSRSSAPCSTVIPLTAHNRPCSARDEGKQGSRLTVDRLALTPGAFAL